MNDVRKSDAVVDFVMANILHPPVEARSVEWESTLDYTSLGKKNNNDDDDSNSILIVNKLRMKENKQLIKKKKKRKKEKQCTKPNR